MDIRERLNQLKQVHAQHVQLSQQTQANIIRLEGAMEILQEQVNDEDAKSSDTSVEVAPQPAAVVPIDRADRAARRRSKALPTDNPPN